MKNVAAVLAAAAAVSLPTVRAHVSIWHPSMWGFNVSAQQGYDNRPVTPLINLTFDKWWWHNHLDYPPHPLDVFDLAAGQTAHFEIACNKGATTFYNTSDGGDIRQGDDPCPGQPSIEFHTPTINDTMGCGLGIVDKDNAADVKPEDFAIFSVNHTCVWHRYQDFQVPADMPACSGKNCICAWFWIHNPDSGAEQMYMNAFQCNVTNAKPDAPKIMTPSLARRCGEDKPNNKPADPSNCTVGAKQPLYWLQAEGSNMHEGYYSPPYYNDLYDFKDGAQNDIFETPGSSSGSSSAAAPVQTGAAPSSSNGTTSDHAKRSCDSNKLKKRALPESEVGVNAALKRLRSNLFDSKDKRTSGLYNKHHKRRAHPL